MGGNGAKGKKSGGGKSNKFKSTLTKAMIAKIDNAPVGTAEKIAAKDVYRDAEEAIFKLKKAAAENPGSNAHKQATSDVYHFYGMGAVNITKTDITLNEEYFTKKLKIKSLF